jgi:hypothetical protein
VKRRRWGRPVALLAAVAALGLTACLPAKGPPPEPALISTSPGLFPDFQTDIFDYVNRCDPNTPTDVQVNAGPNTTVSVNGGPASSGAFSVPVSQAIGERFTLVVTVDGNTTTHHVRCLPTDFPAWAPQTGSPQSAYYATTMVQAFNAPAYSAVFDTNGVPVWWLDRKVTFLLAPFSNKHFAIMKIGGGMEEYNLNGEVVRSLNTVGGPSDFHDVLRLANGHYVMATIQPLQPCNLTSWGLTATETCLNHVFQEIDPAAPAVPVWIWDTASHIPPSETAPNWIAEQTSQTRAQYDPWHYNSVEATSDGYIISFRHMDAIFKINKTTGVIDWKLGGTARAESLDLGNDPGPSGQHDARLQPDGTVSLFDNGTLGLGPGRQPRDVRYAINTTAHTATLVQQIQDADVPTSACCGSARRLPGGNWVTGWGGNNNFAEHASDGTRVFRLFTTFVYRALPLLPGQISAAEFRAGMDAKFAAGASASTADTAPADVEGTPVGASLESDRCCLTAP